MRHVSDHRLAFRLLTLCGVALLVAIGTGPETTLVAQQSDQEVTYYRDVLPILQDNCQLCHQPDAIGPMSLLTYREARLYGSRIKGYVQAHEMPPYHYDRDVGIQELKYDPRLSDQDIATLVRWVDTGMAEGDPADAPPPPEWPEPGEWRLSERFGAPDVVISSVPYDVPAVGQDRWWQPVVETGITEDRCMMAVETKPTVEARPVAHHANSTFRVGEQRAGRLSEYALGKLGEIIPADACRTVPANSQVAFDIHYWPNGKAVEDAQVDIGIWYHPDDYRPKYRQTLTLYFLQGGRGYDIPPHGKLMTRGIHQFDTPVRIDSWQPHGHTRLVAMAMEILRADGRTETVSMVSNWSALWHHSHIYEEHVAPLLEVGDKLILTGWYDNSAENRYNPDPDQWVGIGDRTADEMSHAWIAVTHLDEEGLNELRTQRAEPDGQRR